MISSCGTNNDCLSLSAFCQLAEPSPESVPFNTKASLSHGLSQSKMGRACIDHSARLDSACRQSLAGRGWGVWASTGCSSTANSVVIDGLAVLWLLGRKQICSVLISVGAFQKRFLGASNFQNPVVSCSISKALKTSVCFSRLGLSSYSSACTLISGWIMLSSLDSPFSLAWRDSVNCESKVCGSALLAVCWMSEAERLKALHAGLCRGMRPFSVTLLTVNAWPFTASGAW